ncbi:MAG TPA: hypothetical protein PKE04_17235, partial [Clostridia bacterium]|nr:hypothetical protein [Clostridia bacterium]
MVKKRLLPLLLLCTMILGVGNVQASGAIGVIGGADGPTAVYVSASDKEDPADADSSKNEGEAGDASLEEAAEPNPTPAGNAKAQNLATVEPTASASPAPTAVPTPAPVSNEQIQIRVTLGYGGMLGMMRSMPVIVEIANQGPNLENATLGVNVFQNTTVYDRYDVPVSIASGATKRYAMTITPTVKQDYYAFEVVSNGRILAEERVVPTKLVAPETVFVGVLA